MPISIKKLIKYVETNGFICSKFYTVENACVYIELIDTNCASKYLMYIPSSYDIPLKPTTMYDVYPLTYIDTGDSDEMADKYGINGRDMAGEQYTSLGLYDGYNDKIDIEGALTNTYDNKIDINSSTSGNNPDLKCMQRQLSRIGRCVEHIEYKLAIFFKKYVSVIRRDGSIDNFVNTRYSYEQKHLVICLDLEIMYKTPYIDI